MKEVMYYPSRYGAADLAAVRLQGYLEGYGSSRALELSRIASRLVDAALEQVARMGALLERPGTEVRSLQEVCLPKLLEVDHPMHVADEGQLVPAEQLDVRCDGRHDLFAATDLHAVHPPQCTQAGVGDGDAVALAEILVAQVRDAVHPLQALGAAETLVGEGQVGRGAQHGDVAQLVQFGVETAHRGGAGRGIDAGEDGQHHLAPQGNC